MNAADACSKCGAKVPADAPMGLCPPCLMNAATARTAHEPPPAGRSLAVDRAELLRAIRELNLASAEDLAAVTDDDPARFAQALVREKKLTPYQAGALLAGKARGLVIGQYLVEDKLGSGGMGLVLKARHRPSGRVVALKMLPPSFGREPETVRRFRREFQIASRLNHPNLVAAIEASEDRGIHYLTMEYIPGYDLDTLVSRGGPMALSLALHCAIQVARGLEAAHAQGVIHRDVKPGNIMIDPNGAVRVLDLGLARVIEAATGFSNQSGTLTQTGSYMGTVDFLAPEQANDAKTADARADIYSLGCTLYFLLTANPPFTGDTVLKRLMAHQDRPAPSLRAARPEVSEALEQVYLKMMNKRPSDRPQTMSEVVIALESCRMSAREAGDASADLKTFARTIMKRAPERKVRGTDASVFARPQDRPAGLGIGSDLNLEDLVGDYRAEAGHNPIPEEKLPPIASRPLPIRPQRRRRNHAMPYAVFGVGLLALAAVLVAMRPKPAPVVVTASISSARDDVEFDPKPEPVTQAPRASDAPPTTTPTAAVEGRGKVLLSENFDAPNPSWAQSPPEDIAANHGCGFANGAWFTMSDTNAQYSWDVPGEKYPEMEIEFAVKITGDGNTDPRGGGVIHVFSDVPGRTEEGITRGFQLRINGAGQLVLEPSFWTAKDYPDGPWRGPINHPALKPGGQTNVLKLRIHKRQLEIFANGELVSGPIVFDWDLTPALLDLGADSWTGTVRAVFDRIEIRELPPVDPQAEVKPDRILFRDDFSNPLSGSKRTDAAAIAAGNLAELHEYANGIWFNTIYGSGDYSWSTGLARRVSDFEMVVSARVVGDTPNSRGSAVVHLFTNADDIASPDARAFQIRIDGLGRLYVQPGTWTSKQYRKGPWIGPISNPAIQPGGGRFNEWTIRVEKRRMQILVNGVAVCPPLDFDWDLTPAGISLGVISENGTVRAEFDSIEIRELAAPIAAPSP